MQYIEYHKQDKIGVITLNRPEKRNALNPDMVQELRLLFERVGQDDTLKAVILQGQGKAFCSGADLAYLRILQQYSYEENLTDSHNLRMMFESIYRMPHPLIARVQGQALAGGCGLVSLCDFAIAAEDATLGYTEARIGFLPSLVMVFLLRKMGEQITRRLLLSGELISAQEGKEIGLITKCVPAGELEAATQTFVSKLISRNSSQSMRHIKSMIIQAQTLSFGEALTYATEQNARARETSDCKKGIQAFLAGQKITW